MEQNLKIPNHVAIILDGNGRWAKAKGMPRNYGHVQGAKTVEVICEEAYRMGIQYLTVYAFSTENWNRPQDEVDALMKLLRNYMKTCLKTAEKNRMCVRVLGDKTRLDEDIRNRIAELEEATKNNDGLHFQIAINYGGRDEIVRAVKKLSAKLQSGEVDPADITADTLESYLDTAGIPDPDLLIRTCNEQRISNFLLWQLAYTELYFTPVPWPDFTKEELIFTVSTWYSVIYGLCIMIYSLVCIPIYHKHMKETYSYSENIDLKWLYIIILSFVLFLGLWSFSCFYLEAFTDAIYYFLSCFIWLLICRFINRQENVEMEIMTSSPSDFDDNNANTYETETQESKYAFAEQFNKTFEEKKLYLNPRLTIIDLAHEIGTNRTYISDYLNNELGITFFDYVNQRRLLYAEELLRTTDDSLDSISMESGFNSQSTFRRAFQKKYGCTPGVYRSKINNTNK